jgi:hypothetical protein
VYSDISLLSFKRSTCLYCQTLRIYVFLIEYVILILIIVALWSLILLSTPITSESTTISIFETITGSYSAPILVGSFITLVTMINIKIPYSIKKTYMRKVWQYKHVDLLKLNNEISEFQWESYLKECTDIDIMLRFRIISLEWVYQFICT